MNNTLSEREEIARVIRALANPNPPPHEGEGRE